MTENQPPHNSKSSRVRTIVSWNVNGFRSALRNGGLEKLVHDKSPDVLMLQETKASDEILIEALKETSWLKAYEINWKTANSQKAGYAGVWTLCKEPILSFRVGVGDQELDREGRWLEVETADGVFVNSYFPNSQRDHARLGDKLIFCNLALERLQKLRGDLRSKLLYLAGDINVAHSELDLANPKTNRNNAGFLPEERQWFDQFLSSGWTDVFREFEKGNGHYTWWSYRPGVREKNVGWRLDHFFTPTEIKGETKRMQHLTSFMGSDHCPVLIQV